MARLGLGVGLTRRGGGGGAAAPFDWTIGGAASLARLHLADDLSGADGAAVTSWPDTSGNSLSAYANATGSLLPTLGTKGGRRFVTSGPTEGAGAFLVANTADTKLVSPTMATRVFMLARQNAASGNRDRVFGSSVSSGIVSVQITGNILRFTGTVIVDGAASAIYANTLLGSNVIPNTFLVIEAYFNQTSSSYIDIYEDDGSRFELIQATQPLNPDGNVTIGGEYLFARDTNGTKNLSIAGLVVYDVSSGDMTSAAKLAIRAKMVSIAAEMEA